MPSPHRTPLRSVFLMLALALTTGACGGSSAAPEASGAGDETQGDEAAGAGEGEGPLTDATSPCPADDPSCAGAAAGGGAPADAEAIARGTAVFEKYCDSCHPGGGEDIGPTLLEIKWTSDRMVEQIRKGSKKMKPIPPKRLSDEKLQDLMAYLATIGSVAK